MLQTHRVRTLDQVRSFLDGAEPVEVQPLDRSARYELVARTLRRFGYGYWQLGKADKGVVRRCPDCIPRPRFVCFQAMRPRCARAAFRPHNPRPGTHPRGSPSARPESCP